MNYLNTIYYLSIRTEKISSKNYLTKIYATLRFNNSIKIQLQGKRSLVTIQKPRPT